MIKRRKVN